MPRIKCPHAMILIFVLYADLRWQGPPKRGDTQSYFSRFQLSPHHIFISTSSIHNRDTLSYFLRFLIVAAPHIHIQEGRYPVIFFKVLIVTYHCHIFILKRGDTLSYRVLKVQMSQTSSSSYSISNISSVASPSSWSSTSTFLSAGCLKPWLWAATCLHVSRRGDHHHHNQHHHNQR